MAVELSSVVLRLRLTDESVLIALKNIYKLKSQPQTRKMKK